MIPAYRDASNPCTFCVDNKELVGLPENGECLQFDIDANGTTLFIRETSVPNVSKRDEKPTIEPVFETASMSVPSLPDETSDAYVEPKSERSDTRLGVELVDADTRPNMNHLYTKRWSGKTYFEEAIRKIQMKHYNAEVQGALRKRQLWKDFKRSIVKEKRRDLIRSSGPDWYQDPSRKQICLAVSLEDVLKADYEEEVTGRTRQWLIDLGVTVKVTSCQVRQCMKKSLLIPIDFLLELHYVVLKSQLNVKKKRGDFVKPFSTNERLLLTAVCVLHLPVFLTMLNYILPPEKPFSTNKHVQELLYGDVNDESIRYATPYMEPIPFRSLTHFNQWVFDRVFRALLPSLMAELLGSPKGKVLETPTVLDMKESLLRMSYPDRSSIKTVRRNDSRSSDFSCRSVSPSVSWLLDHCMAKRPATESMFPYYENDSESPRFFSRSLQRKSNVFQHKIHQDLLFTANEKEVTNEPGRQSMTPTVLSMFSVKRTSAYSVKEHKMDTLPLSVDAEPYPEIDKSPDKLRTSKDPSLFLDNTTNNLARRSQTNTRNAESLSRSETGEEGISGSNQVNERSTDYFKSHPELVKVWDEIREVPKKDQLKHAITILEELGDPLARLPNLHKLPTVLRWAELRKGKNRVLDKRAKEDLLTRSRGMWKVTTANNAKEGPKVKCSKRFERNLTWDKKKWLESEVRNEMDKYYTRVKREKVNNARAFFPTMLNHYDYGSKLNRNFRDVYFTYLPAREADTFVYKPWQP